MHMGKSLLDIARDEILERLDELFYGPCYPLPDHFTIEF